MEPMVVIFLSIIFVMLLKLSGKSRKAKLVDRLPGPPGVPLFGNALQFIGVKREDRMAEVMKRDKKYGPIYRNWVGFLPYIHISCPEMAEVVFGMKNIHKGQVYHFLQPWLGRGVHGAGGASWRRSPKLITPAFHLQILESFLEAFQDASLTMVETFRQFVDTDEPLNPHPLLTAAALDSICETAMGIKINAQGQATADYVKASNDILKLTSYRYDRVWLHNDWIWSYSTAGKEHAETFKILHGFTERIIEERKEQRKQESVREKMEEQEGENPGSKKKKAFVDLLLDECENQNAGFTDQQLRDEVHTFIFEGHDTTTSLLSMAMFVLGLHPDIQEGAYQEQLAILGPDPKQAAPSLSHLNRMTLLDRILRETLRLYPSVPFISRTFAEDVEIGDVTIPEGSVVLLSLVSILKDPKNFPDPENFDPNRFLPENTAGRHSFAYIPGFGAGMRNCMGQNFALVEAKTFISYIIRSYRIKSCTKDEEMKCEVGVVKGPSTKLDLRLYSR